MSINTKKLAGTALLASALVTGAAANTLNDTKVAAIDKTNIPAKTTNTATSELTKDKKVAVKKDKNGKIVVTYPKDHEDTGTIQGPATGFGDEQIRVKTPKPDPKPVGPGSMYDENGEKLEELGTNLTTGLAKYYIAENDKTEKKGWPKPEKKGKTCGGEGDTCDENNTLPGQPVKTDPFGSLT